MRGKNADIQEEKKSSSSKEGGDWASKKACSEERSGRGAKGRKFSRGGGMEGRKNKKK